MYSNTTEAIRDMRKRSKRSLYYFSKVVCGMTAVVDSFHAPWANFLQLYPWNGGPPESNRKVGWMAREHFKSTFASVTKPLWLLIHDQSRTIGIISAKLEHPQKWLRQIKYIIEKNPVFRQVFPEIKADYTKWDDTEILIHRPASLSGEAQASVTALSLSAGQASQHFSHVCLDDPVNEDIARSPTKMKRAIDAYDHLESLLKEWETSTFDFVGTPWGRGDVIEHAMETEAKFGTRLYWGLGMFGEFRMSETLYEHHPECIPDVEIGKPIFPSRVPQQKFDKMLNQDPEKAYLQYLCKPYDLGRNGFDLKNIKDYAFMQDGNLSCGCELHQGHDHSIANMSVIGLSDPAATENKKNCESSMTVVAKARCGCRFILTDHGGHFDSPTYITEVTRVCEQATPWGLKVFAIESVAFSLVFRSWLLEKQSEGKFPLGIDLVPAEPHNRDKNARISGQIAPVRDGKWHKRPNMAHTEGQNSLLGQIAVWPYGKNRDRIDGWAYCDDIWNEFAPVSTGGGAEGHSYSARERNKRRELFEQRHLMFGEDD